MTELIQVATANPVGFLLFLFFMCWIIRGF